MRARVAVLADGQRDRARALEPQSHLVEREVGLDRDVARPTGERAGAVGRRDDEEARLGHGACHRQQQLEVAMGIAADRDDVDVRQARRSAGTPRRLPRTGRTRPARPLPAPESSGGARRPRARCRRRSSMPRPVPARRAAPCAATGAARGARAARSPHRRTASEGPRLRASSISGMPTVSTVEKTTSARLSRPRDARTVPKSPPYPPARFETALERGARSPCRPRRLRSLEVVSHGEPAVGELVHAVERVAGRRARLELERSPSERRIAEEVEDGGHGVPRVR